MPQATGRLAETLAHGIDLLRRIFLPSFLTLLLLSLPTAPVAADEHWDMIALSAEARAIALKVQCPICEGESIAESQATLAKQMRALVQEKVDAGWSEQRILDYFEESYGAFVLREPPMRGFSLGLWLGPPIALLAGGFLVWGLVRTWRRESVSPIDATDAAELDPSETERVERELRRLRRSP